MSFMDRLQHAWNVFNEKEEPWKNVGMTYSYRPDRPRLTRGNERSIVTSVYNRIAMDAASVSIRHIKLDENDRYIETIDSSLNQCLTLEANIDQTGRAFIQDAVMSMLDEGCVAMVPIDTTFNPNVTGSYDINSIRTGKIVQWSPEHVKVNLYNDKTGQREDVLVPKKTVAIVENPFYAVMNEPNSTLQRLIRKLNLLDAIDEQSGAGKLDLIVQLPYTIKSEARKQQAESRRKDIVDQLSGTKYGIAYTDGTEKITQLNRPVENNLMKQIEFLTTMLYSQLGITQTVLDGTAEDATMLNYYNRTIEPILAVIVDEMKRKFLTKTARTQKQSIAFFRDPFKLVPVDNLAEIADKFTRNEIMSSNEIRQIVGMKPSSDPKADELRNKNLNESNDGTQFQNGMESGTEEGMTEEEYTMRMKEIDEADAELDDLEAELNADDEKKVKHSDEEFDEDAFYGDDEELLHYASPYYDPVKAHEYYMQHRVLKGRTSTAGLNEEGREAARYVKEQISAEKKSKLESLRTEKQTQNDSSSSLMRNKIAALRGRIKHLSAKAKERLRPQIESQIEALRESNRAEREALNAQYKANRDSVKTEYDNKYEAELDKIKSESRFQSTKKSSSKKSGSSSSSKASSQKIKTIISNHNSTKKS